MLPHRPPATESQIAEANALKEKGNTAFREKRAVELAPTWAKAYRRKASVLDAMKRYQEAKMMYEKALDVIPQDDTLDEAAQEKDAEEVLQMIATLYNKIDNKPKNPSSQVRAVLDTKHSPGLAVLREADRRLRAGEVIGAWPPIGTCARRLWLAEMQYHNAMIHLFEYETRPAPPGYPSEHPLIFGRLQTLEELTTALVEDSRVLRFDKTAMEKLELCLALEQMCRDAIGPNLSPSETIFAYNERLTNGPDPSWNGPQPMAKDGPKPMGWDYVRPALQLSIRSALMNGLLETAVRRKNPRFREGVQHLQRAAELIIEARKQWLDIDGGVRGRTLETTFLRQVQGYLGDALVTEYFILRDQNELGPQGRALLNKILEIGNWIVESVKAEPKPPRDPEQLARPTGEAVWWGHFYSHYASPLSKGYSLIGYAQSALAKDYEFIALKPSSGKPGPVAAEPRRLGLAACAFARSAAWAPVDDPHRCSDLWNAIMCMIERGGYFLADFECIRDMATKCPAHYTDFFPESIVPEEASGKIFASEVVGTVVGMPPNQICSPLVSWPEGTEKDMDIAAEVLEPWTKKIVTGKGGGLLAITDVIQQVWRQRVEDGESIDAIGCELVWNELEAELRTNWEDVWAEHLDQEMPTFTEEEDNNGSEVGSDELEFTRSVVGV
ncbi:hypothetical protein EX30DRAFT_349613 [Ascodesmis nigricans]|uniref:Uncharacterized protein n=1 Tax=Ascodesmis nigricans TaxID=341454 RepID=A0A4S2MUH1_9PEZI|nr:hypothetical protein EX30DRAFT_349613 [Ascodesmis nigricans]